MKKCSIVTALVLYACAAFSQDNQRYWNEKTQLIPWRPAMTLSQHKWHDLDKDGDPDVLTAELTGGYSICWIDDDDDMRAGDLEGDTDSDCLLIDKNKDGIFAGPFDLSLDWMDEDKDGKADIQLIVNNGAAKRKTVYDWEADFMYLFDEDKDGILHHIDWNKIMMQAWEHNGHANFFEDYSGNTSFLKMHASSFSIRDLRYNWENPFIFYDTDKDGYTEWAIRLVDSPDLLPTDSTKVQFSGKIHYAALTWDLDNDNAPGNEFDFDLSMLYKGKGFDYRNQKHRYNSLKGIPGEEPLFYDHRWRELEELIYPNRDSAWNLIFNKGDWQEYRLVMDEDDDCNRWERVEFYDPKNLFITGREKGGLDHNGQADVAGDRGEFDLDGSGKGHWYIGGFDQRIHLAGAEWGVWRIDQTGFYHQGFGGLYDRWKPGRLQGQPERFPTILYKDTDKNGFIDQLFYDLDGDQQFEDSVSFHALGLSDQQPLIDPSNLSYSDIQELFRKIAEQSWQNAMRVVQLAEKWKLTTSWYAFYKNPKSLQEKYQYGYWLQFYIYRDLREKASREKNKELVLQLDKAYYSGNWDIIELPWSSTSIHTYFKKAQPTTKGPFLYYDAAAIKRIQGLLKKQDPFLMKGYAVLKAQADKALAAAKSRYVLDAAQLRIPAIHQFATEAPVLILLYQLSGNKAYASKAWEQMQELCGFPDWGADRHFLDAGIAAFVVSYVQDGLKGYLTRQQEETLFTALKEKVWLPAQQQISAGAWWHHSEHNWNGICNGGLLVSAMQYYSRAPELSAWLATRALNALPNYLHSFDPDGQSEEGLMYWNYGLMYTTQALEAFKRYTGSSTGYESFKGLSKAGWFPYRFSGPVTSLSIGDDPVKNSQLPGLSWFAHQYKDTVLGQWQVNNLLKGGQFYWPDLIYYTTAWLKARSEKNQPLQTVIRGIDLYGLRQNASHESMYIAMHGGANNASHGHLDAGSFELQVLGKVWATGNLGRDNYTYPGYFNMSAQPAYWEAEQTPTQPARWHFYRLRAEGKNCLVIHPDHRPDQNPEGVARLIHQTDHSFKLDLADCYTRNAKQYTREIGLDSLSGRAWVIDSIETKENTELWWSMHTMASISIEQEGRLAVLSLEDKKLYVYLETPGNAVFTEGAATYLNDRTFPLTTNSANSGFRKLMIRLTDVEKGKIKVVFSGKEL
ncbi:hypothetical protein [Flavihumibacter sp. UBA7668]|uniref:hypothetical protein n=1 Tax=Flavihumibacter sp. UBA7668 TaxID=1946542 RepID=UPI0025C2B97C|nr:hypothetical protein [Flavihumibacter sp. UBA7668]